MSRRTYRSPLREQQVAATRQRILEAAAACVSSSGSLDVSMTAVAREARVAEPTVYRHFPTKAALFGALASWQFQKVTAGLTLQSVNDLADNVGTVYKRAEEIEHLVRWTLATPLARESARPSRPARLGMLRDALGLSAGSEDADHLVRLLLLLTSPIAALYWKDYLGIETKDAAATAAWAIRRIAGGYETMDKDGAQESEPMNPERC